MKREQIALALMLAGATAMLCAADIQKDEAGAAKLASYLRGAGYNAAQYSFYKDKISTIVKAEDIPKDVYVATVEKVADEFIADTFVHTNYSGKTEIWFKRDLAPLTLVGIIGTLGDLEFLPWLEKKTVGSEPSRLRERTAISYVKIAGLDAVPFVRKILSGKDEKFDFHCKNLVSMEFFDQIANAEGVKAPQGKINAAYAMLIEQVLNEQNESIAWELDKHLAQHLPEYKASHQRNVVLSHFLQSPNEIARANFRKKQEELQKTPKAERTDLSKRFSGLVEVKLEDEQQTEATKPEEDK